MDLDWRVKMGDHHNALEFFELKIPPLIWFAFFGMVMWLCAKWCPVFTLGFPFQGSLAFLTSVSGFWVMFAGVHTFRKAQTTVNPLHPQNSSELVTRGVYRHTRNPMYVGMALLLAAWFFVLGNWANLLFVFCFVVCINNLQILPEERILIKSFGDEYVAYMERAPRWL
jgi:protein-S-isoprenylcysteine O-methyltransferase Ste14